MGTSSDQTATAAVLSTVGLLSAASAAVLAGVLEGMVVWLGSGAHLRPGEWLLLGCNAAAVSAVLLVPLLLLVEIWSAVGRLTGISSAWLGPSGEDSNSDFNAGTGLLALVIASMVSVPPLRFAHRVVAGFKDAELAATAGSLLGLVTVVVTAAVGVPLFALLRHAAVRISASSSPLLSRSARLFTLPGALLLLSGLGAVGGIWAWVRWEEVVRAVGPGRVLLAGLPVLLFAAGRAFGPGLQPIVRVAGRVGRLPATAAFVVVMVGSIVATVATAGASQRLASVRERHAPLAGAVLGRLTASLDADGDGHARLLGADCNDADPAIHPGALDLPGDGVDQDCFEGDQTPEQVTALLAAAGFAGDPGPRPAALAHVRNVVLLVVDTLRADRLGSYGWTGHAATPNIDALAAESVLFERAYTAAPQTRRAMMAMMSGLYPRAVLWKETLPHPAVHPDTVSLGEMLGPTGPRMVAFYGGTHMLKAPGYFQGIEVFGRSRGVGGVGVLSTSADVTSVALRELPRLAVPRGYVAWLHYTEPHNPYETWPEYAHFGGSAHDRYLQEVARADAGLGNFLAAFRAMPTAAETALVVTADHGEAFGEHGSNYHSRNLYDEEARVPLLIYVPGVAPRRIESPVSLVDFPPTVLHLLDLPIPDGLHGRSLAPDLVGVPPPEGRAVLTDVAELAYASPNEVAVIRGHYKLIANVEVGIFELYDLRADPGESINRFDDLPEVALELRRLMAAIRAATENPANPSDLFTPEERIKMIRDAAAARRRKPVAPSGKPVAPPGRPVAPSGKPVAPPGKTAAPTIR